MEPRLIGVDKVRDTLSITLMTHCQNGLKYWKGISGNGLGIYVGVWMSWRWTLLCVCGCCRMDRPLNVHKCPQNHWKSESFIFQSMISINIQWNIIHSFVQWADRFWLDCPRAWKHCSVSRSTRTSFTAVSTTQSRPMTGTAQNLLPVLESEEKNEEKQKTVKTFAL